MEITPHRSTSRLVDRVCVLVTFALLIASPSAIADVVKPRVEQLPNGLKLLMVERHDQPTVSAGVFYNVGGVNDPKGKSGIAHLFEHMLFKGTKIIGTTDYAAEEVYVLQQEALRDRMNVEMDKMRVMKRLGQIDDVLDPDQWTTTYAQMKKEFDALTLAQKPYVKNNELANIYTSNGGAGLNAGTAEDVTLYFVTLPANKLELFFWMESDRLAQSTMREFYIERDNVREERRLRTDSTPTGKFEEAFNALFWQAHPYGIPVIGWPSEVETITVQDVRDFYAIYYAPNNATIVLVGDFDSDKVVALANQYFGRIPRGAKPPPLVITEEPKPTAIRRFSAEAETNPSVRVRFHTVAMRHSDEAALDVAAELLSGKTGRLYKRLVETEEVAMGFPSASHNARKYAGYFELRATAKEGVDPEAIEPMLLEEVDKLRDGEITDYELQKVKNQVLAGSVRRLQSNMGLMFQLGLFEIFGDWNYINQSSERMLAINADDVRRVVKKYFNPKTRTVAIYRTKKSDGDVSTQTVEDTELAKATAGMPPEILDQARMMLKRLSESTDLDELQQNAPMLELTLSSNQVPPQQKKILELMLRRTKLKIAELEKAQKESN